MDKLSKILILVGAVLVFGVTSYSIFEKESLLKNGKEIYLKLAPIDPRSLMQGDYMALRFEISRKIKEAIKKERKADIEGLAILKLDSKTVAEFKALYRDGINIAQDETLIKYRLDRNRVKLTTDSYFFQEGQAKRYESAKYGLFRVNPATGEAILTSLADANLSKL